MENQKAIGSNIIIKIMPLINKTGANVIFRFNHVSMFKIDRSADKKVMVVLLCECMDKAHLTKT